MIERFSGDFIQWLRGFYAVAESGKMAQAAEDLGVRQPAVSYQIQCLEHELGVQLFHRRSKSLELTLEGQQLLEKTITMFELVKEIRADIGRDPQTEYKGEISFSSSHSISANILAQPLSRFHTRYPKIWFSLHAVGVANDALKMVNNSTIDFAILAKSTVPETIVEHTLFSTNLVLVSNKSQKFSRDEYGNLKNIKELNGKNYISFSTSSVLYTSVKDILQKYNVKPFIVMNTNNFGVILSYVQEGLGVTIVEEFTVRNYKDILDIYYLPEKDSQREYALITRRKKHLSPQSAACIDHIMQEVSSMDLTL